MCRLIAFFGKQAVVMADILDKPENALISQSRAARETLHGLNADGFGVAWYNQAIDCIPGTFKSTQPAWNDSNLRHIITKIRSTCFLGHVRASTVGDVSFANCHPFTYHDCAMAHNGTIRHFNTLRRKMLGALNDELFENVKGNTDSEHFFALIMQAYYGKKSSTTLPTISLKEAILEAIAMINAWQADHDETHFSRLNIILTDGQQLIATRYANKGQTNLSLYYAIGHSIDQSDDHALLINGKKQNIFLIASEPLTDYTEEWHEVPENYLVYVDDHMAPQFTKID